MTEVNDIQEMLRNAKTIEELRDIFMDKWPVIDAMKEPFRTHVINLKDQLKGDFARDIFKQGAG